MASNDEYQQRQFFESKYKKGFSYGDTLIKGVVLYLKNGDQEYVSCPKPIVYMTKEEIENLKKTIHI